MQWYYSKNGAQSGPVDDTELRRLARSGEITPEDLLWNKSLGDQWQRASSFNFLFFHPVDLQPPAIPSETELTAAPPDQGPTSNRNLMEMARASLKGQWGQAVLAMLIYLGIFSLFGFVGALFSPYPATFQATQSPTVPMLFVIRIMVQIVLEFLIMGPLLVGFCLFFITIARRSEISIADLFKGFRIFWKAVGTFVLIYLLSLFWMLLAFLPMIAVIVWTQLHHLRNESAAIVAIVLLGILGWIGATVKLIGYWMSYFVLADHPSTGVLSAIRKSKAMMQGRKWKFVCLLLRFLGWYLLAMLTCCIGLLWVLPYIYTAIAHFYLDVKGRESLPNV